MRLLKRLLWIPILFVKLTTQSQCIVSEWGTWSNCYGGCQKGLIVRNRDVLQPPLPELTPEGRTMQRLCPHLYETRYCNQNQCSNSGKTLQEVNYKPQRIENGLQSALPNGNEQGSYAARNLVERQMQKVGFGNENQTTQAELKRKFISETEQLFKLDDEISRRYGPQPSDSLVNSGNNTPIIEISTQQMSNRQWSDDMLTNKWTSPRPFFKEHLHTSEGTATTSEPQTVQDSRHYGMHQASNLKNYRSSSDHSVSTLLRKIEQALDTNRPLDDKYIKSAMRRNRKLSKLLVDAYRHKANLMNQENISTTTTVVPTLLSNYNPTYIPSSSSPAPTTHSTTTTPHPLIPTKSLVTPEQINDPYTTTTRPDDLTATTTQMLFWPKIGGYVPNTKKHASEITAQLYMTNEIVQTLADDPLPLDKDPDCEVNKRCCKIIKSTCPDGVDPKFVKRWYRPKGSSVCVPYHYPRCSSTEEMEEQPILYEQNCQDLCFSQQEKRISPLFTLEAEDE